MKIEDLKVGRVYRAKRPRVVHTLGGSYVNDRQILYSRLKKLLPSTVAGATRRSAATYRLYHCTRRTLQ